MTACLHCWRPQRTFRTAAGSGRLLSRWLRRCRWPPLVCALSSALRIEVSPGCCRSPRANAEDRPSTATSHCRSRLYMKSIYDRSSPFLLGFAREESARSDVSRNSAYIVRPVCVCLCVCACEREFRVRTYTFL